MKHFKLSTFVLIPLTFLFLMGCSGNGKRIKGSGPIVSQDFDMPDISGVSLSIDADVVITRGDTQAVRIEGQQNIINNIEKIVNSNGIWNIGYYNPVKDHAGITIYITCQHFDYATISGSGDIETTNYFSDTTNVDLKISGSGNIHLKTDAYIIDSEISGSGQIYLEGTAYEHRVNISGSGDVRAYNLETVNTYIRISGSGSSQVNASGILDVTISGSGNVYYLGTPQISINISGSGGVYSSN
ncbi:MAG: DUF2807 domain-containing protein [Bacteroidales bacterium]|nr:DUF2807 domain-containing protein [Bacteroidales bacterium]